MIDVTIPPCHRRSHEGLRVHRREARRVSTTTANGIPVTDVVQTLLDLAVTSSSAELEAAVGAADRLDLIDPEALRRRLDDRSGHRGAPALRALLDAETFVLTHSELERLFVPLAMSAGLPRPDPQRWLGASRVDFHWEALGLVVETDGLRYHRTAAQQARDTARDHAHIAVGRTPVRFSHAQVRFEPEYVRAHLTAIAASIRSRRRR